MTGEREPDGEWRRGARTFRRPPKPESGGFDTAAGYDPDDLDQPTTRLVLPPELNRADLNGADLGGAPTTPMMVTRPPRRRAHPPGAPVGPVVATDPAADAPTEAIEIAAVGKAADSAATDRPSAKRSGARGAIGALTAQVVTAGGSFILQVIAARQLGDSGYGHYALCVALVVTFTALHTGWVGDSLTVMDRHDAAIRPAIVTSLLLFLAIGLVGGLGTGLALGLGLKSAGLLGLLIALWLAEETGRRVLMTRLEFWRLVANDATYLIGTAVVLAIAFGRGMDASLPLFLGSMAAGCAAAVLLALFQLPSVEWRRVRPGAGDGLRKVAAFASWRSAQAGLRPLALLVARLLVLHLVSAAAVGRLEAARLLVAPAQTLINGAGSFLLSTFAQAEKARGRTRAARRRSRQQVSRSVLLLGGGTLVTGVVSLVLLDPLTTLVTGGDFDISATAFIGWTLYIATWAVTLPYVSETVARRLSREVFVARAVDSVLGVVLTAVVLFLDRDAADWVPWLLAAGGVVGAVLLRRLAHGSRKVLRHSDLRGSYRA